MALDKNISVGDLPAWKWTGTETLEFVYALNERCLQVLGHVTDASGQAVLECRTLEVVGACSDLWMRLDNIARARAAKCPFLLLDMRFDSLAWWSELRGGMTNGQEEVDSANSFPPEVARELTGETLTLAWHAARSEVHVASMTLGLSPGIASIIAALTPREVQRIAARRWHELRPRWGRNVEFWAQLLRTAVEGREEPLSEFHLHSLQLLGNDLLRAD